MKPALMGTLNVMKAAARSGSTVSRVVITSSMASIRWTTDTSRTEHRETHFSTLWDPVCSHYARSKTASELSAWLFASKTPVPRERIVAMLTPPGTASGAYAVKGGEWLKSKIDEIDAIVRESGSALEVVTVNPSYVLGPIMLPKHSGYVGSTADILKEQLIDPDNFGQPPMDISTVDVIDVARLHIVAACDGDLSGRRIIADTGPISLTNLSRIVRKHFYATYGLGPRFVFTWPELLFPMYEALTHPKRRCQSVIRATRAGIARSKAGVPNDNSLAVDLLGGFIDIDETVRTTGESLIDQGVTAGGSTIATWTTTTLFTAALVASASAAFVIILSSRGSTALTA